MNDKILKETLDLCLSCNLKGMGKCTECSIYNYVDINSLMKKFYPDKVISYDLCKELNCIITRPELEKSIGKVTQGIVAQTLTEEQKKRFSDLVDKTNELCNKCIFNKKI